jgi:soluble cytochrome b562
VPGPAVNFTPQLPQRDADIESAGDNLAAATVYLNNRQSAAALRAMTQARNATAHAIESRRKQGKRFDVLEEALREIDSAERYVQHGALNDARTRLASLNHRLDASLEY